MEGWAVVSFFMEPDACGRMKRRDPWQYHVEERDIVFEGETVCLYKVYLPGYGRKKKPWRREEKDEYLRGLAVPKEGRSVCYLYGEGADTFLGRQQEILSFEWALFLLRFFKVQFEAMLILEDSAFLAEEWVRQFVRATRYVGILADRPENYEEFSEELFWEYGFIPQIDDACHKLHLPSGKLLVVAAEKTYDVTPLRLPEGCVWLSLTPAFLEGKGICARTKGSTYLDICRFLRKNLM